VKGVKIIRTHVHGAYKINEKLLFHITERRMCKDKNRNSRLRRGKEEALTLQAQN
jgi:hypothetical protein